MTWRRVAYPLFFSFVLSNSAYAEVIASVNGTYISSERVDQVVASLRGKQSETPELREKILKSLIEREVHLQQASKLGYLKSSPDNGALYDHQTEAINAMIKDHAFRSTNEESIFAEYKRYIQENENEYYVRHILFSTATEAEAALTALRGGANFEKLAERSKDIETATQGGALGWSLSEQFPPSFGAAIKNLKKGEVSQRPIKTPYGFSVVRVDDFRLAVLPKYAEIKDQIRDQILKREAKLFSERLLSQSTVVYGPILTDSSARNAVPPQKLRESVADRKNNANYAEQARQASARTAQMRRQAVEDEEEELEEERSAQERGRQTNAILAAGLAGLQSTLNSGRQGNRPYVPGFATGSSSSQNSEPKRRQDTPMTRCIRTEYVDRRDSPYWKLHNDCAVPVIIAYCSTPGKVCKGSGSEIIPAGGSHNAPTLGTKTTSPPGMLACRTDTFNTTRGDVWACWSKN